MKKIPQKEVPAEEVIQNKLSELLFMTIDKSKFRYDARLQDSIWKTGRLIGVENHTYNSSASIADKIRTSYEKLSNFDDLVQVGIGKETIKLLNAWLSEEQHLKISYKSLISNLTVSDIPDDIKEFFQRISNLVDH